MTPKPPDVLRAVLTRYPVISRDAGEATDFGRVGFSGAGVWRIETAAGPVAVRRWPSGWPAERLRGLHRLLEHIHSAGVTFVAVPFHSQSGDTLTEVAGSWWQIEPWLPGRADYHQHPSRDRLAATMTVLARWHRAASTFAPRPQEATWFRSLRDGICPAADERLATVANLAAAEVRNWSRLAGQHSSAMLRPFAGRLADGVLPALPRLQEELRHAAAQTVPLQPCLRDVWHDHILFTGDSVTGLIDPSACRTDTVACDLARLLGSLVEDVAADWQFALDTYTRHRPLSLVEQRLIPILDRSGVVLSAVTWLRWLGPEARRWDDPAPIVDRLQRLSGRLERLANRA